MQFIRKYIYIVYFVSLFLTLSLWDYFRKDSWELSSNFFYSLWVVIVFAFLNLLFNKNKQTEKK